MSSIVSGLSGTVVSREEVIESWLVSELEKVDLDSVNEDVSFTVGELWREELSVGEKEELLDALTDGPVDVFWEQEPIDWLRVELSREEFLSVGVYNWPSWVGWGVAAQPDGSLESVAQSLMGGDEFRFVDGEYILELADGGEWPLEGESILLLEQGRGLSLIDGSHRSTAAMVRLLSEDEYESVTAFVGLKRASLDMWANSVLYRIRDLL